MSQALITETPSTETLQTVQVYTAYSSLTWTLKQYAVAGVRPLTSAVKLNPLYSYQTKSKRFS